MPEYFMSELDENGKPKKYFMPNFQQKPRKKPRAWGTHKPTIYRSILQKAKTIEEIHNDTGIIKNTIRRILAELYLSGDIEKSSTSKGKTYKALVSNINKD